MGLIQFCEARINKMLAYPYIFQAGLIFLYFSFIETLGKSAQTGF